MNVELVNIAERIKKLFDKFAFKTIKIFNEDLTAVLVEYLKDPFKMEMVGSYCLCILVVQCLEGGLNWLLAHARGAFYNHHHSLLWPKPTISP